MPHKPVSQLQAELAAATQQVKVGGHYGHYKHPDRPYLVVQLAIMEETEEACVIYRNELGISFVRPLTSWLETVQWQSQRVPRFSELPKSATL